MLFYKLDTDIFTDKDGNSKVKVNVKDSNGNDFEATEEGKDLLQLFEKIMKDFDDVNIKTGEEEEEKVVAPDNSVETLLRHRNIELRTKNEQLQQEVIRLTREIDRLNKLLEEEKTKFATLSPTFSMDKLNEGKINKAYLNSITDFLTGIFNK